VIGVSNPRLVALQQRLEPLRERLVAHDVYRALRSLPDVHTFLRHHVFCVWDFMSLLKALQRRLTCLDEVWLPRGGRAARRLVNEIVLGEESDLVDGRPLSHFELYLQAMREVGAPTDDIDEVLRRVRAGGDVLDALTAAPAAAHRFAATTFSIVRSGSLPAIAAAFTLGREDVIPAMFTELVQDLSRRGRADARTLLVYLERHVELDGDEHGPMAAALLAEVCGDDDDAWLAAESAAHASLSARIALWDGVLAQLGGDAGGRVNAAAATV